LGIKGMSNSEFINRRSQPADLGWAALFIGSAQLVAAPSILNLATLAWAFSDKEPHIVFLHAWMARVGAGLVGASGVVGLVLGLSAVRRAYSAAAPLAIPCAGLALALIGAALSCIAILGLLNTTERLLLQFG
jgi:hypothetical protein